MTYIDMIIDAAERARGRFKAQIGADRYVPGRVTAEAAALIRGLVEERDELREVNMDLAQAWEGAEARALSAEARFSEAVGKQEFSLSQTSSSSPQAGDPQASETTGRGEL